MIGDQVKRQPIADQHYIGDFSNHTGVDFDASLWFWSETKFLLEVFFRLMFWSELFADGWIGGRRAWQADGTQLMNRKEGGKEAGKVSI